MAGCLAGRPGDCKIKCSWLPEYVDGDGQWMIEEKHDRIFSFTRRNTRKTGRRGDRELLYNNLRDQGRVRAGPATPARCITLGNCPLCITNVQLNDPHSGFLASLGVVARLMVVHSKRDVELISDGPKLVVNFTGIRQAVLLIMTGFGSSQLLHMFADLGRDTIAVANISGSAT